MLRVLAPLFAALAAAGNATELDSTSDIAEVGTLREAAGVLLRNFRPISLLTEKEVKSTAQAFSNSFLMILVTELGCRLRAGLFFGEICWMMLAGGIMNATPLEGIPLKYRSIAL